MPFDALLAPPDPKTLAQALGDRRITPVDRLHLAAHKQAQLARFQPGFWQRHEAWLPIALVGSIGCMAVSGGLTHAVSPWEISIWGIGALAALLSWLPTLIWMSSFALLILFGVFRGRAGAEWQERTVLPEELDRLGVPGEIAVTARTLARELPDAELILGELIEDAVVLDPYLIVQCHDQVACLGIWDDRGVIACADYDPGPMQRRWRS
jgi:hypothetical protein